ncbi:MAG TPA: hypothetical protein VIR65_14655 [Rhizorhapis sp.]
MKNSGMKIAVIAAMALTSVSISACRDDRPGYNSDWHNRSDRDRHDRYDRNDRRDDRYDRHDRDRNRRH